jgi:hypothetical protein
MSVSKFHWLKYSFVVLGLLTMIFILMLMRPLQSYMYYSKLTNNTEFESLMDEYVFLLLNYRNTTLIYPSKFDMQEYYPKFGLLENDLNRFGVEVQHIFADNTFEIKVVCKNMQKPFIDFESNRSSYWSFLLTKSLIWQSFDNQSPDLSAFIGQQKSTIDIQLLIELFLYFDRTNWVRCYI